jgi:O-antigen/teichoic acid export membrane protein
VNATTPDRGRRFVLNVLWNWLGTGASLFIGFVLSPYLIFKLGPDGYGVWAITFSVVEYYWFFDLGFRSATVKFVAHFSATNEPDEVRAVISTALLFSAAAGVVILGVAIAAGGKVERFFQVPAGLRGNFQTLVLVITLSWCLGLVFNVFNASLEAVQCFEYSNKASIVSAAVRAAGQAVLLYLGYKLIALGVVVVISQAIGYAVNYFYFRKLFPTPQISLRFARVSMLRRMASFGMHTFLMTISTQLLNQSAPLWIGHFRPAAFVGYYNLPVRLLQYTVELVGRIGIVTNTSAAELAARGDFDALADLAVYTNRYCLVIFMPVAILLWTHGPQLFAFWVGQDFASHSAPVLPILLAGYLIGMVGQYSASMLLQGLGKHQRYARSLLLEAGAGFALLWFAVPRWGIAGAAWVVASLMILNRGLVASWLISGTVGMSFAAYLRAVYFWPLLAALPVLLTAVWLRGSSVFVTAPVLSATFYGLAFFIAVEPAHRSLIARSIRSPRGSKDACIVSTIPSPRTDGIRS